MESHIGYIMTVSNSIIGVSILAMPFCFKQCGIVLAIFMLLASSFISRLTCHYLLKSAVMARRRTFELLAFHTFGSMGKLIVELGIIGFLMGTCIAFFVIIGDLGPVIIAKIFEAKLTDTLRTTLLVCVAAFCVLPLGLLRNVESLSSVCTATIGFYFCLVMKTVAESASHIATGDWISKVELWRPAGILQCLPIFAMALSCQTQLFEIYETLPNASIEKMNYVVRMAVNICVGVYICVGFFGYIAFASGSFTGNILMSFSPSMVTDVMKVGFVLSVACSFPLVIFPCRASLNSLLFKKYKKKLHASTFVLLQTVTKFSDADSTGDEGYNPYEAVNNFIPETKFKMLTLFIVGVSLIIGILIPNIEVVLGLVGSTIGTLICVIFPVTCFICVSTKNTNERLLAQIILFVGVLMMVLGTYANLYAMEEIQTPVIQAQVSVNDNSEHIINSINNEMIEIVPIKEVDNKKDIIEDIIPKIIPKSEKTEKKVEIRQEPPQPEEPIDNKNNDIKIEKVEIRQEPPQPEEPNNIQKRNDVEVKLRQDPPSEEKKVEDVKPKSDVKSTETVLIANIPLVDDVKKNEGEVDKAAIEKEEKEILEEVKNTKNVEQKNEEILETLKKTKEEQQEMLKEQKKILEEIKKQNEELKDKQLEEIKMQNEMKIKTASQIMEIAKKAIETLGSQNKELNEIEKAKQNIVDADIKQNKSMMNMLPLPLKMKNLTNEKKEYRNQIENKTKTTKNSKALKESEVIGIPKILKIELGNILDPAKLPKQDVAEFAKVPEIVPNIPEGKEVPKMSSVETIEKKTVIKNINASPPHFKHIATENKSAKELKNIDDKKLEELKKKVDQIPLIPTIENKKESIPNENVDKIGRDLLQQDTTLRKQDGFSKENILRENINMDHELFKDLEESMRRKREAIGNDNKNCDIKEKSELPQTNILMDNMVDSLKFSESLLNTNLHRRKK